MSFFHLLLLLTAFGTPLALDYSPSHPSSPTCPSLQPALTVTVTHTLDDVQLVTSTLLSTSTIFSTTAEYIMGQQGKHTTTTFEIPTTVTITRTTVESVIVDVPQLYTEVVPLHITTTVVRLFTSTVTTKLDLTIAKTTVLNKLAHQELYQSTPTVITGVKVIPTCTSKVTVTASRSRGVTSTVDVLVTSIATTTLYTTSASTTFTTLTMDLGVEQCV